MERGVKNVQERIISHFPDEKHKIKLYLHLEGNLVPWWHIRAMYQQKEKAQHANAS